jgi:hypothetical protein
LDLLGYDWGVEIIQAMDGDKFPDGLGLDCGT